MADPRADAVRLVPAGDDAYRSFIPASLALGILLGFALGIHTAVSRLTDGGNPERTADLIQAHGQVQLLGFAGLYIMGMSLRLLPRFSGARIALPSLPPIVLAVLVAALVTRAVALPLTSGTAHDVLLLITVVAVLIAAGCFALVIVESARHSRVRDPSVVAFVSGAALLFLSAVLTLVAALDAVRADSMTLSFLANNAIVQLQLGGFLLSFIAGVSIRAVPVMAGVERPRADAALLMVFGLGLSGSVFAACLYYLEHLTYSGAVAAVASAAYALFGVALLVLAWQAGVLRSLGSRLRPASQPHLWLVRSAFAWLAFAGVFAIYAGLSSALDEQLPGQFDQDAVRHALGVGVVTSLIAGMSLMIVPEFAAQRQHSDQKLVAFALFGLLNLATLLRVAPSLAGTAWTFDQRNLSTAAAGILAEIALMTFAFSLFRLMGGRRILTGRGT